MQSPLPSVETACAALQQEESHRTTLSEGNHGNLKGEPIALYGREQENQALGCTVCGRKRHTATNCWRVIGYPSWHPQYKKQGRALKARTGAQATLRTALKPSKSKQHESWHGGPCRGATDLP
uniref:Uncharacterized protein n=1 Tax=Chenopodium quinoa TaxID=63459 RepID=A0A803M2M6_CHEQI